MGLEAFQAGQYSPWAIRSDVRKELTDSGLIFSKSRFRGLLVCAGVGLLFIAPGFERAVLAESGDAEVRILLTDARTALEKKKLQVALAKCRQALKIRPRLPAAMALEGRCLVLSEEDDRGYAEVLEAISLDKSLLKDDEVLKSRIDYYLSKQMFAEALRDSTSLIALGGRPEGIGRAYRERGQIYQTLHRHEDAIKDFNESLKRDPGQSWTYLDRAITFTAMKNYKSALADYNKVIEVMPGLPTAYNRRAELYDLMGRRDLANRDRAAVRHMGSLD